MRALTVIVTVNAAGLQDGTADEPILVERPGIASVTAVEVELCAPARIVYDPANPRQNGARVWIEAADAKIVQ